MIRFLLLLACLAAAQSNVWTKVADNQVGGRFYPFMAYAPDSNRFLLLMGAKGEPSPFCVQAYSDQWGKWINLLPHDTLYGKWSDSAGNARGLGSDTGFPYGCAFLTKVGGYLRPRTVSYTQGWGKVYSQGAYDPDNGKIYFHMTNATFTFDTRTRLWDSLSAAGDLPNPRPFSGQEMWRWGALCYDPVNREILLFGGGCVDRPNGTPGTSVLDPAAKTWTSLHLAVEPPPRAASPMVYDPVNRCIVMFGGDHLDSMFSDTWVYACSTRTWHKKHPAFSPAPRNGHALLYLPKSQRVILIGGTDYRASFPMEIWTYDVASDSWGLVKRFSTGETRPVYSYTGPGLIYGMAAADTGDRVLILGEEIYDNNYVFNPETFIMQCDPSVVDSAGTSAFGVAPGTVVRNDLEVWYDPEWYKTGVPAVDTSATEAVLRALPLRTWVKMNPPKVYGGNRAWSTTILDPDHDVIVKWGGGHVAWCGTDVPQYTISSDRWNAGYIPEGPREFGGSNNPYPGPCTFNNRPFMGSHAYHQYDYDPNLKKVLLIQGGHTFLYDTEHMDWDSARIDNPSGVLGRDNTGITYTPHGAILMTADGRLWSMDTSARHWVQLSVTGDPAPGYYADNTGLTYETRRDRLILAQTGNPPALYTFDFADNRWTRRTPGNTAVVTSTSPKYREMVYLPNLDKVYFLIQSGSVQLAYDCAADAWDTMAVSTGTSGLPANLEDWTAGMMYDPKRNLVWYSNQSTLCVMRPDSSLGTGAKVSVNSRLGFSFTALPNPFSNSLRLLVRGATGKGEVRIYDMAGRAAAVFGLEKGGLDRIWNPERLASGMYLAKISLGHRIITRRLLFLK